MRQERVFRDEVVVLRHNDWGEADRLLVVFGQAHGKLKVVAKGVRKLRSRKAGHLEPFTRVTLLLARGRDLPVVTQAETVDAYLPLREDLTRTIYASYFVELLDRFTYEEGENRGLYSLLVDTLGRLASGDPPWRLARYYEVRLLDLLGFRPELSTCVVGGEKIQPQAQYFSALAGGVLCPNCGRDRHEARPISLEALRFLRHFQRSNYAQASRGSPSAETCQEIENLLQYYLTYLLERSLNSTAFLHRIKPQQGPA